MSKQRVKNYLNSKVLCAACNQQFSRRYQYLHVNTARHKQNVLRQASSDKVDAADEPGSDQLKASLLTTGSANALSFQIHGLAEKQTAISPSAAV
jgi:hypothetical protein